VIGAGRVELIFHSRRQTARQENDWEALKMLCDELYVHLTPEQNDLVFILLQGGYGKPHVT
jgi:hypothetical protein